MRPQNEVLWELRTNSDDRHQMCENIKFFLLRCAKLGGKRAKHVIAHLMKMKILLLRCKMQFKSMMLGCEIFASISISRGRNLSRYS